MERELDPLVGPDTRDAIIRKIELVIAEEHFSGPLPHPQHFEHYATVEPSAPTRILAMAENEQQFRHRIIEQSLKTDIRSHFAGLGLAWILNLGLISGAVYLGALGQVAVPAILMGAAALNVVKTFVDSSWRKSRVTPPPSPPTKPLTKTPAKRNRRR